MNQLDFGHYCLMLGETNENETEREILNFSFVLVLVRFSQPCIENL